MRDPAIRGSAALTQSRTWTVDTTRSTPAEPVAPAFTVSTPTTRPVGGTDVVYAETTHPTGTRHPVTWTLDGAELATGGNDRAVDLEPLRLTGTHTLTASTGESTLTWTVDATDPETSYELSEPLLRHGDHHVYNGPFTMSLRGADETPGYLVREFRTDGDGWYNYFGWPTDPDAPFLFTPSGTNIDDLVYGKLGTPRLSPWDDPTPDHGRHTIEYRTIDPSGNIGPAGEFAVTLLPAPPECTRTLTGRVPGPLTLTGGVTCLDGATVTGPVAVRPGAGLVATGSTISGAVTAAGADAVELLRTDVSGAVSVTGTARVTIVGGTAGGPVVLSRNHTGGHAPVLAGVTVRGPIACARNVPAPSNLDVRNAVSGPSTGQCAGL